MADYTSGHLNPVEIRYGHHEEPVQIELPYAIEDSRPVAKVVEPNEGKHRPRGSQRAETDESTSTSTSANSARPKPGRAVDEDDE